MHGHDLLGKVFGDKLICIGFSSFVTQIGAMLYNPLFEVPGSSFRVENRLFVTYLIPIVTLEP